MSQQQGTENCRRRCYRWWRRRTSSIARKLTVLRGAIVSDWAVASTSNPKLCSRMRTLFVRKLLDWAPGTRQHFISKKSSLKFDAPLHLSARHVWNDALRTEAILQDHFYDSTAEKVRSCYLQAVSLKIVSLQFNASMVGPAAVCAPASRSLVLATDARVWTRCAS